MKKVEIERLYEALALAQPGTEKYQNILSNIVTLTELDESKVHGVSKDMLLKVAAQVGTVVLMLNFEKLNIFTTKAGPFAPKV